MDQNIKERFQYFEQKKQFLKESSLVYAKLARH